ncbi:methyl-accepting chemotaxis protein [Paraburkholderia atlantica]|nr:hypothetical protein [Paraburkholderia atlantica]MBB5414191.1 methyl-accepting chemotaxis protein [Paraburkholderia atlantica]
MLIWQRNRPGKRARRQSGATMSQVMDAIQRVSILAAEISNAGARQGVGVGQVGAAVNQMDETTQRNAALVEESAAAAESLRQQAANLVDRVAPFRL